MLACLPPRHPCGERAAKEGAFRILWPFSLCEKFSIHNMVFFSPLRYSPVVESLPSDQDRHHWSSLSWCSSIPGTPTCSRCLPLPCFHNYVSVYFQKGPFFALSLGPCVPCSGGNQDRTCDVPDFSRQCRQNIPLPLPSCYNIQSMKNDRFLS